MLNDAQNRKDSLPNDDDLPEWLREIRGTAPQSQTSSSTTISFSPSPASSRVKASRSQTANHSELKVKTTLQIWTRVLRQPNLRTFQVEMARANLTTAMTWMRIVGLVGGLISSFGLVLWLSLVISFVSDPMFGIINIAGVGLLGSIFNVIFSIMLAPVYLRVISGMLFVIAKLFGGTGDFEVQTYLIATFYAPFYLASRILGLIPLIGWLMLLGCFIYLTVPSRYVIQAVHRLSTKKSLYVVLIPFSIAIIFYSLFLLSWSFITLGFLSSKGLHW